MEIDDTPRKLKGSQSIKHSDGYVIPPSIRQGLAYMDMTLPNDSDLDSFPHVNFPLTLLGILIILMLSMQ